MAKTGNDQPKVEGAKVTLPSLGTYVYMNGKWMHKSGDGYDFEANSSNAKMLNQKLASGDYEIWDNEKGGYVKGVEIKPTAEQIKKGGDFRNSLQDKNAGSGVVNGIAGVGAGKTEAEQVKPVSTVTTKKKPEQVQREVQTVVPLTKGVTKLTEAVNGLNKTAAGEEEALASLSATSPDLNATDEPVAPGLFNKVAGSEILGYIPDVIRGVTGLIGASEKVPEYVVPQEWTDHVQDLKEKSTFGIDDATTGEFNRQLDRTYASDVNSIRNLSGGSAGVALGNLNRASYNRNEGANQFAMADENAKQVSSDKYGNALGVNLDLSRMMFGDKYNLAMMNKTAGAQLAADALSDIGNRATFNETYGKGSKYDELMQIQNEDAGYLKDIHGEMKKNGLDLSTFDPAILGLKTNDYSNYLLYGMKQGEF